MILVMEKAARVLTLVSRAPGIDLKRLAQTLDLKKPGLLQLLRTLVKLGFLRKDPGGGYHIGAGLCDIVRPTLAAGKLESVACEHASSLAGQVGEDVTIACLRNGQRQIAGRGSADQSVVVDPGHEARLPIDRAATGLVLLAWLSESDQTDVAERNELVGGDNLVDRLAVVRKSGYARVASDDGHAWFLAVPVAGEGGEVIAAIGVSVPAVRLSGEREAWLIERMRTAAQTLGAAVCTTE